jgi:hypothetical protein
MATSKKISFLIYPPVGSFYGFKKTKKLNKTIITTNIKSALGFKKYFGLLRLSPQYRHSSASSS